MILSSYIFFLCGAPKTDFVVDIVQWMSSWPSTERFIQKSTLTYKYFDIVFFDQLFIITVMIDNIETKLKVHYLEFIFRCHF